MKNRWLASVLSVLLCLSPVVALAESESPAIHSDFTLSMSLHADGYPESTSRLGDWETFLSKLSLKGYVNAMDFPKFEDRAYMNAGLYVNGQNRIPFVYDGYHSYRYLISPMFRNESVHFQMHNFFDFMMKPFHFMGLRTQYPAFFLYPEATSYLADSYYAPVAEALKGTGSRVIPHEKLYELAETLNLPMIDDPYYERAYVYLTTLLYETGMGEAVAEKLSDLESYLAFLDPEQQGMQITVTGNQETYVLGKTTVFVKKQVGDALAWTLTLPDPDGYALSCQYEWTPSAQGASLALKFLLTQDKAEAFSLSVAGSGLPCQGDVNGQGSLLFTLGGSAFEALPAPQGFDFRWSKDQVELPYQLKLDVDWLHPDTAKPALSLHYAADMKQVKPTVFKEGAYSQQDFFSLNEGFLSEYKERYLPTLTLSLMPIMMEMPTGVLNDLYDYTFQTGILAALGF